MLVSCVQALTTLDAKTGLLTVLLTGIQGWKCPVALSQTCCGSKSLEVILMDSNFGGYVYYESLKRALKTKTTYGYRCDERLKTNVKESTRLACTRLCAELEHLKIETRLTSETPVSEMVHFLKRGNRS